jgi:hypothetical protein
MTIAGSEEISRKDQARNAGDPPMGVMLTIRPIFTVIRRQTWSRFGEGELTRRRASTATCSTFCRAFDVERLFLPVTWASHPATVTCAST